MSIVSNPLIGKTRKSMGGVTFSSWKGINVMKEKAANVANPNTALQQAQRGKFSTAVSVYQSIPEVVKKGFAQLAIKKSAYNAFCSTNSKAGVFSSNNAGKVYNKTAFSISQGTLDRVEIESVEFANGSNICIINYRTPLPSSYGGNEDVMAVVVKADGTIIGSLCTVGGADSGSVSCKVSENFDIGQLYHAYLAFYQPATRKATGTSYMSGFSS